MLYAWQQARLPEGSQLTLVCRNLDPGIEQLISETKQIRLLRGVDTTTLSQLYTTSTLFVMPSLVEGFGQVFLEALSYGCPILGTPNTCLPDLGTQADGVFITPAGDVDQLAEHLEDLAVKLPGQPELRNKARACASRFSMAAVPVITGELIMSYIEYLLSSASIYEVLAIMLCGVFTLEALLISPKVAWRIPALFIYFTTAAWYFVDRVYTPETYKNFPSDIIAQSYMQILIFLLAFRILIPLIAKPFINEVKTPDTALTFRPEQILKYLFIVCFIYWPSAFIA